MKIEVNIADIHTLFDVRGNSGRLDQDKIAEFAIRAECGEELGLPILVSVEGLPKDFILDVGKTLPKEGFVVIDGRHRIEVYRSGILSKKYQKASILCDVRIFKSFVDMLAEAGTQNDRPGTPLTRKEWKQNIGRMVGLGNSRVEVLAALQNHGMSKERSERLWQYYREREGTNTLKRALNDVNLRAVPIPDAAKKHRVSQMRLKKAWDAQRTYNIGKFCTSINASTRNWERAMETEYKRAMELELNPGDKEQAREAVQKVMERMYTRIGNLVF